MHDDAQLVPLKIDAIISQPKAMQDLSVPLQFPEPFEIGFHHLLRQPAELAQNVQLQFLGHLRQFNRAGWIEDDLERSHRFVVESLKC